MILLQSGVTELTPDATISQLTESSIHLAEAAANFGALKLMFGVFIVFIFIVMLFFVYQMMTYNKTLVDIHTSARKIEDYFEDESNKSLGKPQANVLIRRTFNSLSQTIKYIILRTRLENKPSDLTEYGDQIVSRVDKVVKNEYTETVSFLETFDCDGIKLSEGFSVEDCKIISEFVVEQVKTPAEIFSISAMDQSTDILIGGIKLDVLRNFS